MAADIHTKLIEVLKLMIHVIMSDIKYGICGMPGKCMQKIAIERALREIDPRGGDHKVRIDGGTIKFNYKGFHYSCPTPRKPKLALIQFDKEAKLRARAAKTGEVFVSKVKPHSWKLEAVKGSKIIPMTPDRQRQINDARRRRIEEGRPDRTSYNLSKRVVGLGNV